MPSFIESVVSDAVIAQFAADISCKVLLVAALVWTVMRILRAEDSAVLHRTYTFVLVCMLIMPALVFLAPRWKIPIGLPLLSGHNELAAASLDSPLPYSDPTASTPSVSIPASSQVSSGIETPTSVDTVSASWPTGDPLSMESPAEQQAVKSTLRSNETGKPIVLRKVKSTSSLSWVLVSVYLVGLSVLLLRMLVGIVRCDSLLRRARLIRLLDTVLPPIGTATVLESSDLQVPVTLGLWRPRIVLPADWKDWTPKEVAMAVTHEAEHVRRYDTWTQLFAALNCAIYWFHPLSWVVSRRLSDLAEIACDDAVISATGNRADYAKILVNLASRLTPNTPLYSPVSVGMARQASVEKRVLRIIDARRPLPARLGWLKTSTLAFAVLTLAIVAAGISVTSDSADAAEPQQSETTDSSSNSTDLPRKSSIQGRVSSKDDKPVGEPALAGYIRNAKGEPSDSAMVVAYIRKLAWESKTLETRTDSKGYFKFINLPEGWVTLTAYDGQEQVGGRFCGYIQEQGRLDQQKIRLFKTQLVKVRILNEVGEPVSKANLSSIRWRVPDSDWFWLPPDVRKHIKVPGISSSLRSDIDGRITIPGVPRNAECIVQVQHADYAQSESESFKASVASVDVTIKHGNPVHLDVIDAASEEPITDAYIRVSGSPDSTDRTERVDDNGQVTLRLADASRVTIRCIHPEMVCPSWFSLSESFLSRAPSSTSTSHTFKLSPKGKVRGKVLDEHTGAPLEGVYVSLVADNRQRFSSTRTIENGSYELTGPADFVTLQIRTGNGFWAVANQQISVKIEAGVVVQARPLEAKKLPVLKGQVVDEQGTPFENAVVFVAGISASKEPTLTDSNGKFQLQIDRYDSGITAEAASLETPHRGTNSISILDVVRGKALEIRLAQEGVMRGKLVDESGSPLTHVQMQLSRRLPTLSGSWRSRSHTTTTDREGKFDFGGLESSSRYALTTFAPTWREAFLSDWYSGGEDHDLGNIEATAEQVAMLKPIFPGSAPALDCPNWLNSEPLELEDLEGKVVLLDFWGTWCGPCIAELPMIQKAHELYASKGLVVIGVHNNVGAIERVPEFLAANPWLTYPIAVDNQEGTTCAKYDVRAFPTAVLIGRDGKILQSDGLRGEQLLLRVREAMLYE